MPNASTTHDSVMRGAGKVSLTLCVVDSTSGTAHDEEVNHTTTKHVLTAQFPAGELFCGSTYRSDITLLLTAATHSI
jgi:hypothetical protein